MDNSKEAPNHFASTAELVRKTYGKGGDDFVPHVQHLLDAVRPFVPDQRRRVVSIMELIANECSLVTPHERLCFFAFCEALERHEHVGRALEDAETTWVVGFYPNMHLWNPTCSVPRH